MDLRHQYRLVILHRPADVDYSIEEVLECFACPFVDASLLAEQLGGAKDNPETARLFLALPLAARPDLSWYFDRAYYLIRHPDIAEAGVDPLLHFVRHGIGELRAPHPLIEPRHMRELAPGLLPDPLTPEVLLDALENDLVEPSRYFDPVFYRSQLEPGATRGLLRHYLSIGLLSGLRPAPGVDAVSAWREARRRSMDIRAGLRELAITGPGARDIDTWPPSEGQAKALFVAQARALLPLHAAAPLDFTVEGKDPALSVIVVVHDQFALTMATLAGLRANYPGPMQVIVVDSGSRDETRMISRYLRGAAIMRFDENLGFVRGCNAALEGAVGPIVLFLNNDVDLAPGAIKATLSRMRDPTVGAVGAKLIRAHGMIQEAGSIVWRDGRTAGYMRDASPLAPEVNFVRDVDYCSGAFLAVRTSILRDLAGFDEAFAPGYYEDVDLCLRIRQAGHRVVYDPKIVVRHLEHGSSGGVATAVSQMDERREIFVRKHLPKLLTRYAEQPRALLFARSAAPPKGRVLFIEDQVPLRRLGQGFVRSNDILHAMAASGRDVTAFPLMPSRDDPAAIYADMPETAEVMFDRGLQDLDAFLRERRGYYDAIWIARTHNLDRVKPVLDRAGLDIIGGARIILDSEAIIASREAARCEAQGRAGPAELQSALKAEFQNAWFCHAVVAVNEQEARRLRELGHPAVSVLGHARRVGLTPRSFDQRSGLLFVGALAEQSSPNVDALEWFVRDVLPRIETTLGYETHLTVAGFIGDGVDLSFLEGRHRVSLRGAVPDLEPLYNRHRVFVAPTRFAAGIPYKVHEAASAGLPVVTTDLLAGQLGWTNGRDLLAPPAGDADSFAEAVIALYRDPALWRLVRENAAGRVRAECDPDKFADDVGRILAGEIVS